MNRWNNHWTFFRETSFSNRLSTVNFIWNFPLRPERKFFLRRKNFFCSQFSFWNYMYTSVEAPLCYRMSLTRIGRSRNVTICDFRHVLILSVKNVILSQNEWYIWPFSSNYIFCHHLMTTDIQFVWYLLPNNYSKGIDSQKIFIYRTKSLIKHYISWAGTHWVPLYGFFSAYSIIPTCCEHIEPLKQSLNYFSWN